MQIEVIMKELPVQWIDFLITRPEIAMGYQMCTIEDKNGIYENVVVSNCSFVPKYIDVESIERIII
jgi:hypothetical protein